MALLILLLGASAAAGEDPPPKNERWASEANAPYYYDVSILDLTEGIQPQAGVIVYSDGLGQRTGRSLFGATFDVNVLGKLSPMYQGLFVGPAVGVLYSHIGPANSGFFGASTGDGDSGANFLLIPFDVKLGVNFTDTQRFSFRAGANLTYRSVANSMSFGSSSAGTSSEWVLFPNVGVDYELLLGKRLGMILRPDLTIAPASIAFTATFGLMIGLS
ncbi:MAG: hypothetical protein ACXWOH_09960 [Bdellovibrionota bacterium]